jgi:hypothetical protein
VDKTAQKTEFVVKSFLFVSLFVFIHLVVTSHIGRYEGMQADYYRIQDFHYYIVMIKSFWFNEITSIYDPKSQLVAINNHLGTDMNRIMPLGISPTALLVMLPFSVVARFSMPLANSLWVTVFLSIYAIAILRTYSYLLAYERSMLPLFILVFCIFLVSFRTVTVIILGQTSLMASALLLFLLLETVLARREGRSLRRWLIYPVIFILSMKMHYLVLGMGILLLGGYVFELLVSSVILGSSVGLLVAYAGPDLLTGFIEQISLFSAHALPAYYHLTGVFHTIITFRSAFAPIIGDPLSLKISIFVLAFGGISIFWIFVSRHGRLGKKRKYFDKGTEQQVIIALFALLFLFLPYIGGYEDVLLCVPFAVVFLTPSHIRCKYGKIIAVIPFLFVVLNQSIWVSSEYLWLYWGMKMFLFLFLILFPKGVISPGELIA